MFALSLPPLSHSIPHFLSFSFYHLSISLLLSHFLLRSLHLSLSQFFSLCELFSQLFSLSLSSSPSPFSNFLSLSIVLSQFLNFSLTHSLYRVVSLIFYISCFPSRPLSHLLSPISHFISFIFPLKLSFSPSFSFTLPCFMSLLVDSLSLFLLFADGKLSQNMSTRVLSEPRYNLRKRNHPKLQKSTLLLLPHEFEKLTIP